jgi:thiamine kinase-like enzyme
VNSGGDILLSGIPDEVVTACRAAWDALPAGPMCVVHGDPSPENFVMSYDGDPLLIDWDKARVDHPWFDLAVLTQEAVGLTDKQWLMARRALCAWQIVTNWRTDPEYAHKRLRALKGSV